ncbi:MAG: hypothetical protein GEU81_10170 [Nitriliruptorales bacterium]|nr:hypothetical protein [Nitriliruptorales bacterium]
MIVEGTAPDSQDSQGSTEVRLDIRGREYRYRLEPERGWWESTGTGESRVTLVQVLETAYDAEADPGPILRAHRAAAEQQIGRAADVAEDLYQEHADAMDLMDYHDIAELCGFTPKTAINYNANRPGPPYMPAPVLNKGGSPLWARSSVKSWHSSRKGYDWRKGITNEELAAQGRPLPGHRRRPRVAGETV